MPELLWNFPGQIPIVYTMFYNLFGMLLDANDSALEMRDSKVFLLVDTHRDNGDRNSIEQY